MKIFIGGSLSNIEKNGELCHQFVTKLGELIVERGHILLNGCRGSLDKKIAESANSWLEKNGGNPQTQIISYICEGEEDKQVHSVGKILNSEYKDWGFEKETPEIPEQIANSDVTVFIAGSEGTYVAANFARLADKPIIGIGTFGGSGNKLHKVEKKSFTDNYGYLLSDDLKYDDLNVVATKNNAESLAKNLVSICENLRRSRKVFTIMSFKNEYKDVYESFKSICKNNDYKTDRTDEDLNLSPITAKILEGIKQSDFVIADVSEMSANVFYEIGYAKGIKRDVVITAKEGIALPFDIKDLPVIYYDRLNMKDTLEPQLDKVIGSIKIRR
jgi:hypothetical protein